MSITRIPKDFERGNSQGRLREQSIYVGFVKRVDDAQRMGRIAVYIPELSSKPDDESQWIIVSYASPFAGASDPTKIQANSQTAEGSQTSYGFWMVPPDLNNEVLVCFANGDISRGFWFGCLYQQFMNHMVPGIACNVPTDPTLKNDKGTLPPVVEYNKANASTVQNPARPVFQPLYDGLKAQGLAKDFERGPASTSARREAPSKVFGYSTPRGNCMHIDDNEENELIRLRTRSGAQILIHETTGYVYINSKNGNSWVEISDSGVNIYSQDSVSVRSEADLNFRADGNIALDAGESIALRAGQGLYLGAGQTINMGAGLNLVASAGGSLALTATGDLTIKSDANLHTASSADTSILAGGNSYRDGALIADNAGKSASVADNLANLPAGGKVADFSGGKSTTTNTIASTMPTHEPWSGHAARDKGGSGQPAFPSINSAGDNAGGGGGSGSPSVNVPTGEGPRPVGMDVPQQCGMGKAAKISDEAHNAFKIAADKTGLPMAFLMAVAQHENGKFDPLDESNPPFKGMMQVGPAAFSDVQRAYPGDSLGSNLFDTQTNIIAGSRYLQISHDNLVKAGIPNPTYGEIYAGHIFGPTGSAKLAAAIAANPDQPANLVLPAGAAKPGNNSVFYQEPGHTPKSVSRVAMDFGADLYTKANAFASEYGLPPPCQRAGTAMAGNAPSGGTPANAAAILAAAKSTVGGGPVGTGTNAGQCAQLVEAVSGVGRAPTWSAGAGVVGNTSLAPGTPIAAFDPTTGRYTSNTTGASHAAIYLGQNNQGIQVIDQWVGQPPHVRTIYFGHSPAVNNANAFSVINSPTLPTMTADAAPPITQA